MNEDRGMVKWVPYKSLVEQTVSLAKMKRAKERIPKPQIANDQAMEINEILTQYAKEEVEARYWEDGFLYDIKGIISKVDAVFRFLILNEKKIPFSNLIRLARAY